MPTIYDTRILFDFLMESFLMESQPGIGCTICNTVNDTERPIDFDVRVHHTYGGHGSSIFSTMVLTKKREWSPKTKVVHSVFR